MRVGLKNLKRSPGFLTLFGVAVFAFILGSCFQRNSSADKAPYRELEKFSKVFQYVRENYVEDVSARQLVEGAIKGMLESLDAHSAYLNQEVYREMKEETEG